MLYLLWGILNIGIFIYFIIICFRATKLIREKIGLLAAVFFAIGLLSFITAGNNRDNREPNSNQVKTWNFFPEDNIEKNTATSITVPIDETLVSTYNLDIIYGKHKQEQFNLPVSANSSVTGWTSGTNWKPVTIIVERTNDNTKFDYWVHGVTEWKLLGLTIFSQGKVYKGTATVR
jgi:hypothetical protein